MCELKANPDRKARGLVIEAQLDKGKGPVATVLVQKGTLHVGDCLAIGSAFGKVRAMVDDKGRRVKEAGPSIPVEILGLNDVPEAGEVFISTNTEKEARSISETFIAQKKEKLLADTKSKLSLDGLFDQIQAGQIKELNLIVKADVQGSVEAVKQSLLKLSNDEVAIKIIHGGVGAINESDVTLASTSNAIIIGFNVRPDNMAKTVAETEKVDMRLYRVIYNAIEDIEAAMKGMLDPEFREKITGHAEVRQTYKVSGVGTIIGGYVLDGKIERNSKVRLIRDNVVEEVHHAKEEGIQFHLLNNPVEILVDDAGWVRGIRCIRMELGEPDESGRRSPVEIPGSEYEIEADTVIMSLGTSPNPLISSTTKGLDTDRRKCIVAEESNGATSRPGVFAGGDAVTGAATVILAMGAGKAAAAGIHEYLQKNKKH